MTERERDTHTQRQTDRARERETETDGENTHQQPMSPFFVRRERAGWRPSKYRRQHFRRLSRGVSLSSLVLRLLQSGRVSPTFVLKVPLSTTISKPEIQTERLIRQPNCPHVRALWNLQLKRRVHGKPELCSTLVSAHGSLHEFKFNEPMKHCDSLLLWQMFPISGLFSACLFYYFYYFLFLSCLSRVAYSHSCLPF